MFLYSVICQNQLSIEESENIELYQTKESNSQKVYFLKVTFPNIILAYRYIKINEFHNTIILKLYIFT